LHLIHDSTEGIHDLPSTVGSNRFRRSFVTFGAPQIDHHFSELHLLRNQAFEFGKISLLRGIVGGERAGGRQVLSGIQDRGMVGSETGLVAC